VPSQRQPYCRRARGRAWKGPTRWGTIVPSPVRVSWPVQRGTRRRQRWGERLRRALRETYDVAGSPQPAGSRRFGRPRRCVARREREPTAHERWRSHPTERGEIWLNWLAPKSADTVPRRDMANVGSIPRRRACVTGWSGLNPAVPAGVTFSNGLLGQLEMRWQTRRFTLRVRCGAFVKLAFARCLTYRLQTAQRA